MKLTETMIDIGLEEVKIEEEPVVTEKSDSLELAFENAINDILNVIDTATEGDDGSEIDDLVDDEDIEEEEAEEGCDKSKACESTFDLSFDATDIALEADGAENTTDKESKLSALKKKIKDFWNTKIIPFFKKIVEKFNGWKASLKDKKFTVNPKKWNLFKKLSEKFTKKAKEASDITEKSVSFTSIDGGEVIGEPIADQFKAMDNDLEADINEINKIKDEVAKEVSGDEVVGVIGHIVAFFTGIFGKFKGVGQQLVGLVDKVKNSKSVSWISGKCSAVLNSVSSFVAWIGRGFNKLIGALPFKKKQEAPATESYMSVTLIDEPAFLA